MHHISLKHSVQNKKSPDFSVETTISFLFPQSSSGGFSLSTSTHCSTNRFVCNFLSSSVGFNPCNCFFPTHLCLPLSFPTFSRLSIPQLSLLPFLFLTSAVSAFFRPLQFWILTTQPLFFLSFSSWFRLTVASPVPVSALASSVSPFSPA